MNGNPIVRPNPNKLSIMPNQSPFTLSPRDAGILVRQGPPNDTDKDYYIIHLTFHSVYGGAQIPSNVCKKLPRLLNGIPFGAGHLGVNEMSEIKWRYVETQSPVHTFLSVPLAQTEAEESKRMLRDRLMTQAQAIFGDVTVKTCITLSRCLSFDADLFLNDIADTFDTGLHFKDS